MLSIAATPPQASASFSHKFSKLILEALDPSLEFTLFLTAYLATCSGERLDDMLRFFVDWSCVWAARVLFGFTGWS